MGTRRAASRGSGTKVARASAPPNTPSLEKNSSADATNKPVRRPVSTAAEMISRLIRTDTTSVCHRHLKERVGDVGTAGADRRRGSASHCFESQLRTSWDYPPADPRPVTLMEEIEHQLCYDLKATDGNRCRQIAGKHQSQHHGVCTRQNPPCRCLGS